VSSKVTATEFRAVKRQLLVFRGLGGLQRVARKARRSVKTITQIKHSKTYADYSEQNKAQHPEIQYSLAEQVFKMHHNIWVRPDTAYIKPQSAKQAATEILELMEEL